MLKTKRVYNPLKKFIGSLERHGFTIDDSGLMPLQRQVTFKNFSYGKDYISVGSDTVRYIITLEGAQIVKESINFEQLGKMIGSEINLIHIEDYFAWRIIHIRAGLNLLSIRFGGQHAGTKRILATKRLC